MESRPSGARTYVRMQIRAPALEDGESPLFGWVRDIIPDPKDDIVGSDRIPIDSTTLEDRLNEIVASLQDFGAEGIWREEVQQTDWYEFQIEAILKMTVDEITAIFGDSHRAVPFSVVPLADCTDGKGPGPRKETRCLICKEKFQLDTKTATHSVCRHTFCRECLWQWHREQDRKGVRLTCPMDRQDLVRSSVHTHLGRIFMIRRKPLRLLNGEPDFQTAFNSWLSRTPWDVLLDRRQVNIMQRI